MLVGVGSGAVSESREQWWTVLDGTSLFTDPATVDPDFVVAGTPVSSRGPGATAALTTAADLRVSQETFFGEPSTECAIIVNGSSPGEVEAGFAVDVDTALTFFDIAGFNDVAILEFPDNHPLRFAQTVEAMAQRPECANITIYITTHGWKEYVKLGGEWYSSRDLSSLRDFYNQARYNVIIDACYSGSMMDDLVAVPNVDIAISATDGQSFSWGDIDGSQRGIEDPNGDADAGGEFSSSLFDQLTLLHNTLLADAEQLALFRQGAADQLTTLMSMTLHCAFTQSGTLDIADITGRTRPLRSANFESSPCTVTWTSRFASTESEGSDFGHTWEVVLTQSASRTVTGRLSFHAFPGGGRVQYALTGQHVLGIDPLLLTGNRGTARGPLATVSPSQELFLIRVGRDPEPNLVASGDLSVRDLAAPASVQAGTPLTVTFTIKNGGPESVSAIEARISAGGAPVTFSNGSGTSGGCTADIEVRCRHIVLVPGSTVDVAVTFTAAAAGEARFEVVLASAARDPSAANNRASVSVTVTPPPE